MVPANVGYMGWSPAEGGHDAAPLPTREGRFASNYRTVLVTVRTPTQRPAAAVTIAAMMP
jgi:hypothetical protein